MTSLTGVFAGGRSLAQIGAADRTLELAVSLNGAQTGAVGEFIEHDGALFATPAQLDELGIQLPPADKTVRPGTRIPLSSIPGLGYRLDERTQTIVITAEDQALQPTRLQASVAADGHDAPVQNGLGADLNYEVVDTVFPGGTLGEAFLDGHAFSPWGLLSASGIATVGDADSLPPFVRLDTSYSNTDVAGMRSFTAGDFINGGLSWSRPIRLGGIQVASDFGVRPDLVTFPVPSIAGQVAVPSSVDVLVNGVQLLSQTVPTGPFQINQLPVVSGAGDVSVVTRNSAGQQTVVTRPFYSSNLLLRPGLSAYSAEIGAVRLDYGLRSDDYQAPAASLTYRYGLSDWLTLEGHTEATAGSQAIGGYSAGSGAMAGGGGAFTIDDFAVASLDLAGSQFGGHGGGLVSASIDRLTSHLSFSGSVQLATKGYADVAAAYGQPAPTLLLRASIGLTLRRAGSFGLAFVGIQQPTVQPVGYDTAAAAPNIGSNVGLSLYSLSPQSHVSLLSASYSRPVLDGRAFVYATAFEDLSNADSYGAMFGITFPFGRRGSLAAGLGAGHDETNETLEASEAANTVGQAGFQVLQGAGDESQNLVSGSYKSPWGLYDVTADHADGVTDYRADAQGAIAFADGTLFATNTIADSFAVVDTDHTPGIEVMQENRPFAKTGPSGLVLVPDLMSFGANRLSIDPNDVPLDAGLGATTQWVRPGDHAGVVVHFPIHASHGALLRILDETGAAIPVGSAGRLVRPANGETVTIGYDGEAYVTGLGSQNRLLVTKPDGRQCVLDFAYRPEAGVLPKIGPIICRGGSP